MAAKSPVRKLTHRNESHSFICSFIQSVSQPVEQQFKDCPYSSSQSMIWGTSRKTYDSSEGIQVVKTISIIL